MAKKIIGATVGTPINPQTLIEKTTQAEETKLLQQKFERMSEDITNKVDGAYADKYGYLYLTSGDEIVVGPIGPFAGSGGGGGTGNNAELTVTNTSGWLAHTTTEKAPCSITLNWSSLEGGLSTGNGVANVKVNGVSKLTKNITQGDVTLDIKEYLAVGENAIIVTVTDVYGNTKNLSFSVEVVTFSLSSPFDEASRHSSNIQFPYIPVGNVEKEMHFVLSTVKVFTSSPSAISFTSAVREAGL